jgi:hypothetical protein
MNDQLPAVLPPGALAPVPAADTYIGVPALIADLGNPAAWRYVEFFAANIRNPNTRRAYARACSRFFGWCKDRGLTLIAIRHARRGTLLGRYLHELVCPLVQGSIVSDKCKRQSTQ